MAHDRRHALPNLRSRDGFGTDTIEYGNIRFLSESEFLNLS